MRVNHRTWNRKHWIAREAHDKHARLLPVYFCLTSSKPVSSCVTTSKR